MTRLTYIANVKLRSGDKDYQPGDDVSHFAPLIPHVSGAIEGGKILLKNEAGLDVPPRTNPRMHPELFGPLMEDVKDAIAAEEAAAADAADAEDPSSEGEAPLPAGDDEQPAEGADASDEGAGDDESGDDDATDTDASDADAFDPSEHNIDDVLAHLEENPDDLEALIEAEKAGKARTTLLATLEAEAAAAAADE